MPPTFILSAFLSTLSLRRATEVPEDQYTALSISIHALLAESDALDISAKREASISIHALLAESDPPVRDVIQWEGIFLSTLSLRRATEGPAKLPKQIGISIHALLAESDS